jgi:hypothetical protein
MAPHVLSVGVGLLLVHFGCVRVTWPLNCASQKHDILMFLYCLLLFNQNILATFDSFTEVPSITQKKKTFLGGNKHSVWQVSKVLQTPGAFCDEHEMTVSSG